MAARARAPKVDFYTLLGVEEDAESIDIKKA